MLARIDAGHEGLDVERSAGLTSIDVIASALEPLTPAVGRLSSPDGALTLMLSDIADADTLASTFGQEDWDRLLSDHHLLVGQLVAHHDGTVVKVERDGFLATFNSAHGGLHAALELQQTFAGPVDEDNALALRIGMHAGFVISGSEELLGRNVVLAARIAAFAAGGQILISSTLKEYTESDPTFEFEPRGAHHFKGLLGEHELYEVRWN
jgi:class 3 adenylate cyclase